MSSFPHMKQSQLDALKKNIHGSIWHRKKEPAWHAAFREQFTEESLYLPDDCGYAFHWDSHGRAWGLKAGGYHLNVPQPTTALNLGIAFHEFGHVLCGHLEEPPPSCPLERM